MVTELMTMTGFPHWQTFKPVSKTSSNMRLTIVTNEPVSIGDLFCFNFRGQGENKIEFPVWEVESIEESRPSYGCFKTDRPDYYSLIVSSGKEWISALDVSRSEPYSFTSEDYQVFAKPTEKVAA